MTLRCLPGGARERHETQEIDLERGARDARRVLAIEALVEAGLSTTDAKLCVHQLEGGAADAFVRAYSYLVLLGVNASAFRRWCLTHGYYEVVGQVVSKCCACGGPVDPRKFAEVAGCGRYRCQTCVRENRHGADKAQENQL
jgi:hypothetical protein